MEYEYDWYNVVEVFSTPEAAESKKLELEMADLKLQRECNRGPLTYYQIFEKELKN